MKRYEKVNWGNGDSVLKPWDDTSQLANLKAKTKEKQIESEQKQKSQFSFRSSKSKETCVIFVKLRDDRQWNERSYIKDSRGIAVTRELWGAVAERVQQTLDQHAIAQFLCLLFCGRASMINTQLLQQSATWEQRRDQVQEWN